MRIAYVCADPGIPVFGQKGCSIHVQEVIRALQHQGATVELFATRCEGIPPADLANIKVHALPPVPKGKRGLRESTALLNNPHLQIALAQKGPFDLIYERYSLWSYAGMQFARQTGVPGLLEVNAPLIEEEAQYRELVHRDTAEQVAKLAFQAASGLVAVSQAVKQYLRRWVSEDRVHIIPNGVNHHRFTDHLEPSIAKSSQTFTVGFVGSLKPWHGLSHLANAFTTLFQNVPQARLLVVGDGPQRNEMELALIDHKPVTHFTGAVSPEQIPGLLASMDVAVAPYPDNADFYFSPLKVVEYMAAGLPVVASRIGQLTALIEEGRTGLLCSPGDEVALAAALEELWRSPDLRQSLGQAARQHILTHHTWDAVAQQILTIAQHSSVVPLSTPTPALLQREMVGGQA